MTDPRPLFSITALDGLTHPDHPIVSFLGIGLATAHDIPVRTAAIEPTDAGARITFEWG